MVAKIALLSAPVSCWLLLVTANVRVQRERVEIAQKE